MSPNDPMYLTSNGTRRTLGHRPKSQPKWPRSGTDPRGALRTPALHNLTARRRKPNRSHIPPESLASRPGIPKANDYPHAHTVYSRQYTQCSIQFAHHSIIYTVHSVQSTIHSAQYNLLHAIYTISIQYTGYSIQYSMYSTGGHF
jgi:hypothetical protein